MAYIEENVDKIEEGETKLGLIGVRHAQFFMISLLIFNAYAMRINLSVGILEMTKNDTSNCSNCDLPTYPEWHNTNTMLSAFFWGYGVIQIIAGQLIEKYGPKWFLTITTFNYSVLHILIPLAANYFGSNGVIVIRVAEGLNQGFLYPSTHHLISKWSAKCERATIGTIVYAGGILGTAFSMVFTGFVSNTSYGWPLSFYLFGSFGLLGALFWLFIGSNSPSKHKSISTREKLHIQEGLNHEGKRLKTPWLSIFTSLPFWAIILAHGGQAWGFFTLVTELPKYLKNILKFDIGENSLLSALPYLTLWMAEFIVGPLADMLITKNILRVITVRKLFHTVGSFIPAAALFSLGWIDESQKNLAIVLLVISVSSTAPTHAAFLVNHIDLAPNHAGTLLAITNTFANCCAILAPLFMDLFGRKEDDPMLWRITFWFTASLSVGTSIFYILFASADLQPWNDLKNKKFEEVSKKENS